MILKLFVPTVKDIYFLEGRRPMVFVATTKLRYL